MSHRKPLSLLYSVRYRRAVSLPLTSLVSHRKPLSLFLPPAAVELVSPTDGGHYSSSVRSSRLSRSARDTSQLTDKKSPSCTLFDIGALFRSRSHHLYLTESRSPFFCHWQRSSSVLRNSQIKNLPPVLCSISACCFAPAHITCISQKVALPSSATGSGRACFSLASLATPFKIGAVLRLLSHLLFFTEPRSPFSCHWQQSYSVLRNSQIKNLPPPVTDGGRLLVLCSFVSSLSLRSRYFATHR